MGALRLTISRQEQAHQTNPTTQKKHSNKAAHFFGTGSNKEIQNAVNRPTSLKGPASTLNGQGSMFDSLKPFNR